MHQEEHLHFAATDGVKVLELPYQNGALAMDFVLPERGRRARRGRGAPHPRRPGQVDGRDADRGGHRLAPQVRDHPAASLSLGDTLSAMGMPLAFDRRSADFTGIANPPSPGISGST